MRSLIFCVLFLTSVFSVDAQNPIEVTCQPGLEKYYPLVRAIYARMGFECVFSPMPSERALAEVNSGFADAEIGRTANATSQYPNLIYTKEPMLNTGLSGWALPELAARHLSPKDLKNYSLGILRGNKAAEIFVKEHELSAQSVTTVESLSKMLEFGRIQIAIMPQAADSTLLDSIATRMDVGAPQYPVYHLFSPQNKDLATRWDQALKAMKADGSYLSYLK